jgi:hypothetical protein
MAVYWKIQFEDGSFGWQEMDDDLNNARVLDLDGAEIEHPPSYSWHSDTEMPAFASGD